MSNKKVFERLNKALKDFSYKPNFSFAVQDALQPYEFMLEGKMVVDNAIKGPRPHPAMRDSIEVFAYKMFKASPEDLSNRSYQEVLLTALAYLIVVMEHHEIEEFLQYKGRAIASVHDKPAHPDFPRFKFDYLASL